MSFILRWLGLGGRAPVVLHPRRDVELAENYDGAYTRVLAAMERVLGANVSSDDRVAGRIEARFGLVNNERIVCTLERLDGARTLVRIEAHFPAVTNVPRHSLAVDTLAASLSPAVSP